LPPPPSSSPDQFTPGDVDVTNCPLCEIGFWATEKLVEYELLAKTALPCTDLLLYSLIVGDHRRRASAR
jgi:hypothetical protein